MKNKITYNSDDRELILRIMDLFLSEPSYARNLDFEVLNELFPDMVPVFEFMLSEEYEDKSKLHSIVNELKDKGLRRMLSLSRGYND